MTAPRSRCGPFTPACWAESASPQQLLTHRQPFHHGRAQCAHGTGAKNGGAKTTGGGATNTGRGDTNTRWGKGRTTGTGTGTGMRGPATTKPGPATTTPCPPRVQALATGGSMTMLTAIARAKASARRLIGSSFRGRYV